MRYLSKKKYNGFIYQFYYLLIIFIIILFKNSETNNIRISLIKNESEIKITFLNRGGNRFLSTYYYDKPSSIESNNPSSCDRNTKTCDIQDETKNITLFFKDKIIYSCKNMFCYLDNILEIDLSNFDSSQVSSFAYMFNGCSNLKKINFGNMDTSKATDMTSLFYNCNKLTSLDLSNFDTSSVIDMSYMFTFLKGLTNLKLSEKFNTSKVIYMSSMFSGISALTTIDLSMFDTSQVEDMSFMFSNAEKLNTLNISNFKTSRVEKMIFMFSNCYALNYLDIANFNLTNSVIKNFAFINKNNFLKICINHNETINYLNLDKDKIICSDTCFEESNIYIDKVNNKCVQTCDSKLYEYDIFCLNNCPQSTKQISIEESKDGQNKNICIDNTPEGYYFDSIDGKSKQCFKNCKYCYGRGDKKNNNCKVCISGYKFINDIESNENNCYEICKNYYYFDSNNNYHCKDECPNKYNKIILQKKRCIDDCKKDNKYKIEFNNDYCIDSCQKGTIYNEEREICETINTDNDTLAPDSNDLIVMNLQESIIDGTFNNVIEDVIKEGNDYTITTEKIMYQITTSDNQKNN